MLSCLGKEHKSKSGKNKGILKMGKFKLGPKRDCHVSYGTLKIREYDMAIGDNPSVRRGPPIGLSWKGHDVLECHVDEYEDMRTQSGRRHASELVMPHTYREALLLELGFPRKQIVEATRRVVKTRKQRVQTVNNLNMAGFEETIERLRKAVFSGCMTPKVAEPAMVKISDLGIEA
mmetsp:Transcript_16495/g.23450  ORF Transcript_16495/g.23450 Transcript_16495/m.23450 type:complete len:176 (+) Transcript_16495:70-597(+)